MRERCANGHALQPLLGSLAALAGVRVAWIVDEQLPSSAFPTCAARYRRISFAVPLSPPRVHGDAINLVVPRSPCICANLYAISPLLAGSPSAVVLAFDGPALAFLTTRA